MVPGLLYSWEKVHDKSPVERVGIEMARVSKGQENLRTSKEREAV